MGYAKWKKNLLVIISEKVSIDIVYDTFLKGIEDIMNTCVSTRAGHLKHKFSAQDISRTTF